MKWDWSFIAAIIYLIIILLVCLRVIYDTRSTTKTIAYLLLIIFLPVIGILIYFSFGINYRREKIYSKKLLQNSMLENILRERLRAHSIEEFETSDRSVQENEQLFRFLLNEANSPLTGGNNVQLLINGEDKFPLVLDQLKKAKNHIHIEYYIYENDEIGNALADILIAKVAEGVEVRFIYDDFGSHGIRRDLAKKMRNAGVKAFPFYKISFIALANRLNYRNHRKIIIVDGEQAFIGGINVSDRYINGHASAKGHFWRDTHLFIKGPGVSYLQYLFMTDWNYCANDSLGPSPQLFPRFVTNGNTIVQTAASGPDSDNPTILYSILLAVSHAQKELLITTPYFIPGESIMEALIVKAYSGVKVKLLVPGRSDSVLVNSAAKSYYAELIKAGVEIYRYTKGFVHAKTLVVDRNVCVVGTANMDHRSFDLNFEVNTFVYDGDISNELALAFENDLKNSEKIDKEKWLSRPLPIQIFEKTCRLLSPLL